MNSFQRVIKYCAVTFAIILAIGIIAAIVNIVFGIVSFSTGRTVKNHSYTTRNVFSDEDNKTVDFSGSFTDVRSLDIDNSTGELRIKTGDTFSVEAENVMSGFEAKVKGDGTLTVTDREAGFLFFGFRMHGINNPNSKITIYVPEDFMAEEVKIESGAGSVSIEQLNTEELTISAGAGNITGKNITANEVKLDGGVGAVNFSDVSFTDAEFNCGVGGLNISGVLKGNNKVDCGVGSVDLDLSGRIEDYDLDIDSGVGSVRVNGEKVDDDEFENHSAANSIEIDGGVGDVRIDID